MQKKPAEYQNLTKPFLGGLLLGALGASALTGLVALRAKREEERWGNPFSWPAIVSHKGRVR